MFLCDDHLLVSDDQLRLQISFNEDNVRILYPIQNGYLVSESIFVPLGHFGVFRVLERARVLTLFDLLLQHLHLPVGLVQFT